MATFVLIAGAYGGGWWWKKVTPLLRVAGHEVYTPTLTGLGERAHLLSPDVDLSTHIRDIVNLLYYEDLEDVVLVGHSNGGMAATGAAEATPERIRRLVYLDVPIPEDGQSSFDAAAPGLRGRWTSNASELNGTRVYWPSDEQWLMFLQHGWQLTDPDDIAWIKPRLTPQPIATMEEPIKLTLERAGRVPVDAIVCESGQPANEQTERIRATASVEGRNYYELRSGHVPKRDRSSAAGRPAHENSCWELTRAEDPALQTAITGWSLPASLDAGTETWLVEGS